MKYAKRLEVAEHRVVRRRPRRLGLRPEAQYVERTLQVDVGAEAVLLGCLAQRTGSIVDLDPVSGRLITSLPDEWINPAYRSGYRAVTMERAG